MSSRNSRRRRALYRRSSRKSPPREARCEARIPRAPAHKPFPRTGVSRSQAARRNGARALAPHRDHKSCPHSHHCQVRRDRCPLMMGAAEISPNDALYTASRGLARRMANRQAHDRRLFGIAPEYALVAANPGVGIVFRQALSCRQPDAQNRNPASAAFTASAVSSKCALCMGLLGLERDSLPASRGRGTSAQALDHREGAC